MRFTGYWHRKAAPTQVHGAAPLSSSLADTSDRLDRGRHSGKLPAHDQYEPALEAAISSLRGVVAHVASADALTSLGNDVCALATTVSDGVSAATTPTGGAMDLEQRIASIADAIAALRAENRRCTTQNIESMIAVLSEEIEQGLHASPPGPPSEHTRTAAGNAARSVPGFRNLESIERGVAELTRNVVEMRAEIARCMAAQGSPPLVPESLPAPYAASPAPLRRFDQTEPQALAPTSPQPLAKTPPLRPRRLPEKLVKMLAGIGLTAALAFVLQLLVSHLVPHAAFESAKPQAKAAERGPRLDSRLARVALPDRDSPILAAAHLPSAFAPRLIASAAAGDPTAAYEVGIRLSERPTATGASEQAIIWLERAARAGLAPAQLTLGGIYEKGLGVPKDPQRARLYYLAAAIRGNAKAMHNLAVLHAQGVGGKADHAAAAEWFRKAAVRGVTDSQFNLAVLYEHGTGVEQSLTEAYKWFALAARQGDAGAARKRVEIAGRLDAKSRDAMDAAIETWAAEPQPDDSITVRPPPGGWDQAPAEPPQKLNRNPQFGIG